MSSFSAIHFILVVQTMADVLFTVQYSHCAEHGDTDFHNDNHHSPSRILMLLLDMVETFLPADRWTVGAGESLVHTLLNGDTR